MNSSYDIGVYPYDDYIENNFFEMIDSFKENKEKLKDFLNDLVLVKVENHFGDAENSYSTFFRKGNIEEMFGIFDYSDDKIEIFELNLKEKEFEENYMEIMPIFLMMKKKRQNIDLDTKDTIILVI